MCKLFYIYFLTKLANTMFLAAMQLYNLVITCASVTYKNVKVLKSKSQFLILIKNYLLIGKRSVTLFHRGKLEIFILPER